MGDAAWAERLLSKGIKFGTIREYFAAFADTGENLSMNARATVEKEGLARQAPAWAERARSLIVNHFRLRKYLSGAYRLKPFNFSVYIRWDSFGFRWPHQTPILSQRDRGLPALDNFSTPFRATS